MTTTRTDLCQDLDDDNKLRSSKSKIANINKQKQIAILQPVHHFKTLKSFGILAKKSGQNSVVTVSIQPAFGQSGIVANRWRKISAGFFFVKLTSFRIQIKPKPVRFYILVLALAKSDKEFFTCPGVSKYLTWQMWIIAIFVSKVLLIIILLNWMSKVIRILLLVKLRKTEPCK